MTSTRDVEGCSSSPLLFWGRARQVEGGGGGGERRRGRRESDSGDASDGGGDVGGGDVREQPVNLLVIETQEGRERAGDLLMAAHLRELAADEDEARGVRAAGSEGRGQESGIVENLGEGFRNLLLWQLGVFFILLVQRR